MKDVEIEIARESLLRQAEDEVMSLRTYLGAIDERMLRSEEVILGATVEKLLITTKSIENIASVLRYLNAWEENGDPPQLSYKEKPMVS